MEVTREDVLRCARLADLEVQEEALEPLAQDMSQLLSHVERLQELDLDQVPPFRSTLDIPLRWREDIPQPGLSREDALRNAPAQQEGQFLVPKVL